MIFPFFRCISTFCFLHGTLLFGLSVLKKGNSVSLSPIKCMYWFYVTIFSISSLYYDVGVKSFWPLWYRIALHCVLPQFSKTFVIRSFFFEKWLLTHVFGGSQGQKFSCKQACVELLTFWPWYHIIEAAALLFSAALIFYTWSSSGSCHTTLLKGIHI